ncbi:hypothetical protein RRG08_030368 [Elysia crispata]|uniref:Uncharacterized protein n=1 Tax=Elysia crispata TaxID=231223 RepID=A0AAE0YFQ6_9GAST|nr:hypothetical protein RRG08_030368 [Elysia crispata]
MVDDWMHTLLYLTTTKPVVNNDTSGVTSQYGKLRSEGNTQLSEGADISDDNRRYKFQQCFLPYFQLYVWGGGSN